MATDLQPIAIGARIAQARKEAGLTQEALAKSIGYIPRSVAGWERNETHPRPVALQAIATATGRTVAWFYELEAA
jgi:transcriptional regulator with XRE-family HTH domain